MKKQQKPKKFNLYSKPYEPNKPPEFIQDENKLEEKKVDSYEKVLIPEGTKLVYLSDIRSDSYFGDDATIVFCGDPKEVKNPHYEKQLKIYEQDYKKYKEDLKEYEIGKAIYDEQQKKKNEEAERKQYKKLKAKFG